MGYCPKCGEIKKLTKHHVYPRRFQKTKNETILYVCRECHDDIEKILPQNKLSLEQYKKITLYWLKGFNPVVKG